MRRRSRWVQQRRTSSSRQRPPSYLACHSWCLWVPLARGRWSPFRTRFWGSWAARWARWAGRRLARGRSGWWRRSAASRRLAWRPWSGRSRLQRWSSIGGTRVRATRSACSPCFCGCWSRRSAGRGSFWTGSRWREEYPGDSAAAAELCLLVALGHRQVNWLQLPQLSHFLLPFAELGFRRKGYADLNHSLLLFGGFGDDFGVLEARVADEGLVGVLVGGWRVGFGCGWSHLAAVTREYNFK